MTPIEKYLNFILVFDVESVGLHGEGFAAGYVVMRDGVEVAAERFACEPEHAAGAECNRVWVKEHCVFNYNLPDPEQVRENFWERLQHWKAKGASIWADCIWPVEASFLNQCVRERLPSSEWAGPYPFFDIATMMLASGLDPLATYERLANELPAHDPLADARQSARMLLHALSVVRQYSSTCNIQLATDRLAP